MQQAQTREWLTVNEFKKRHPNLGKTLIYEAVRSGSLRSLKLGGKILIASDSLDELANEPQS